MASDKESDSSSYVTTSDDESGRESSWIGTPYHKAKGLLFFQRLRLGSETFQLKDCVLVDSGDKNFPYIARIERFLEDSQGNKKFRSQWFFRARDHPDLKKRRGTLKNEVFLSDHSDINSVFTIMRKCNVFYNPSELEMPPAEEEDKFVCRYHFRPTNKDKDKIVPLISQGDPPPPIQAGGETSALGTYHGQPIGGSSEVVGKEVRPNSLAGSQPNKSHDKPGVSSPVVSSPRLWHREESPSAFIAASRSKRSSTILSSKSTSRLAQQRSEQVLPPLVKTGRTTNTSNKAKVLPPVSQMENPPQEPRVGDEYQVDVSEAVAPPPEGQDDSKQTEYGTLLWSGIACGKKISDDSLQYYLEEAAKKVVFSECDYVYGHFRGKNVFGVVSRIVKGSSGNLVDVTDVPDGRKIVGIPSTLLRPCSVEEILLDHLHSHEYDAYLALLAADKEGLKFTSTASKLNPDVAKQLLAEEVESQSQPSRASKGNGKKRPRPSDVPAASSEPKTRTRARVANNSKEIRAAVDKDRDRKDAEQPEDEGADAAKQGQDSARISKKMRAAVRYLKRVRATLRGRKELYRQFLYTLDEFQKGLLTRELLSQKVDRILQEYPDLIQRFRNFYPSQQVTQ